MALEIPLGSRIPTRSAARADLEILPIPPAPYALGRIVALAREHLGMEVSFVAECANGMETIRVVDGPSDSFGLRPGMSIPLEETYCQRLIEGRIPNLIPDTRSEPGVRDLAATSKAGIGSYVGVPIVFSDGRTFGTLCCLSHGPDDSLRERDVRFMKLLSNLVADELEREERESTTRHDRLARIQQVIDEEELEMVFQPILDLQAGETVGVEALARFPDGRPPDAWFAEAAEVGLQVPLEMAAVRLALARLGELEPQAFLSVNVSPQTILAPEFLAALAGMASGRVVVEVTEHARIDDYASLNAALKILRSGGVRLAIDDVGAGFASLRHILRSQPDIIKLDITLTRDIDTDPVRRALATALLSFSSHIEATMTAEGIETLGEVAALRELGVGYGQGFYLAMPGPVPSNGHSRV